MSEKTSLERYIESKRDELISQVGNGHVSFHVGSGAQKIDTTHLIASYLQFYTKAEASAYAISIGWNAGDAKRYTARFSKGWIVAFQLSDKMRIAVEGGGWIDVPLKV